MTDIEVAWLEGRDVVGVTSGASAPEWLVERVVDHLRGLGATDVRQVHTIEERIRFSLPAQVRQPVA